MRDPPLILVVDDVPDNVDILQMRLEAQGYQVVTAESLRRSVAQYLDPGRRVTLSIDTRDWSLPGEDAIVASVQRETKPGNIWLEAPNTAPFIYLANVNAVWVALAFDQNARPFVAWATVTGNASYNWFDSTIPGFRTSTLTGTVPRVFASLDDSRPIMSSLSDILLAYVRAGTLFL